MMVNRPAAASAAAAGRRRAASPILISASGEVSSTTASSTCARCAPTSSACTREAQRGVLVIADAEAPDRGCSSQVVDQMRLGGVDNISFGTSS